MVRRDKHDVGEGAHDSRRGLHFPQHLIGLERYAILQHHDFHTINFDFHVVHVDFGFIRCATNPKVCSERSALYYLAARHVNFWLRGRDQPERCGCPLGLMRPETRAMDSLLGNYILQRDYRHKR